MAITTPFRGILPAMQVPFDDDLGIDEEEMRRYAGWLAGHDGVGGLVTNGHTGEVYALSPAERARATRLAAEGAAGRCPVISGICAEGMDEAVEHARMAKAAGASGLLVMPPHYWLRFGMRPEHVIEHFSAIGDAVDLNLVVHVYPAWTKASYSEAVLHDLAGLPWVTTFKVGTREMSKYDRDIRAIRAADPDATVLTCHDEYLLPSMVQGVDGALVGFASFIPELVVDLYRAVCAGDLDAARSIQERIYRLKQVVYGAGEPTGDAHARMKMASYLSGRLASPAVRPPTRAPSGERLERIEAALRDAGMLRPDAA